MPGDASIRQPGFKASSGPPDGQSLVSPLRPAPRLSIIPRMRWACCQGDGRARSVVARASWPWLRSPSIGQVRRSRPEARCRVQHWKQMNRLPSKGGPQNEERGALFYELIEIIFCYAELLENLIKKPVSDLAIAMNWDCSCAAIWMLPSGVTSLLPHHLKSKLSGRFLKVPSFGRHEWPLHLHLLEASVLLLCTHLGSFRRHLSTRPALHQESCPRRGSLQLRVRRQRMCHCLLGE